MVNSQSTSNRSKIQIGQRFGRWTVIGEPFRQGKEYRVPCRCDCATESIVFCRSLWKGASKSCGCYKRDMHTIRATKHGGYATRLYETWRSMIDRCEKVRISCYDDYGGRGISVCIEWHDFTVFRAWALSHGYDETLTIDRRDNNLGYFPDNCQWITLGAQQSNTRRNHRITAFGETKHRTDWTRDERCTVTSETIRQRLENGMTPEDAISLPKAGRYVTAWSETKPLIKWVADQRCVVGYPTLASRLNQGISPEVAITTPAHPKPQFKEYC